MDIIFHPHDQKLIHLVWIIQFNLQKLSFFFLCVLLNANMYQ